MAPPTDRKPSRPRTRVLQISSGKLQNRDNEVVAVDAGLSSVEGAQRAINTIKGHVAVKKLILPHNELGDDGCILLLSFLRSAEGRTHRITNLDLSSNKIGNSGLLAIAEYLTNNLEIKQLSLQNNLFHDDITTTKALVKAINSSGLEIVELSTNNLLADSFAEVFFPCLDSTYLRNLNLSATGLSSRSLPYILEYLSSPLRCHLRTFSVNANSLGTAGVKSIITAIAQSNYRLTNFNFYSNHGENENPLSQTSQAGMRLNRALHEHVSSRNTHLIRETEQQALELLRTSRPLLLHPNRDLNLKVSPSFDPCDATCSYFPSSTETSKMDRPSPRRDQESSPFMILPTEIKHHILSFFAPILSSQQRIRIYQYATSPSTLPQLLPCLPSSSAKASSTDNIVCIADPSSLGFGEAEKVLLIDSGGVGVGGGCAAGKCMGSHNSVVCHRKRDRNEWLAAVGCDSYDRAGRAPGLDMPLTETTTEITTAQ